MKNLAITILILVCIILSILHIIANRRPVPLVIVTELAGGDIVTLIKVDGKYVEYARTVK